MWALEPIVHPSLIWLYGPISTFSFTTDLSIQELLTRQSLPITESLIVLPGPTTHPVPIFVSPRIIVLGKIVLSLPTLTSASTYTVSGSRIVTPLIINRSNRILRWTDSTCESCTLLLTPKDSLVLLA